MRKIIFFFYFAMFSVLAFAQEKKINQLKEGEYISFSTKSRMVTDTIYSNILGDKRAYTILLPRNYELNQEKKYPVLYLLHGLTDTNEAWDKKGRLKTVMDRLVESGETCEMIVVTPNAGGDIYAGVWNGYFNMPGWNYEDFFFQEFLPYIEKRYRIISDKQHRAIGGLSMGGGGSTVYTQRYPEMFCACYAMSALMTLDANGGLPSRGQEKMDIFNKSVLEHSAIEFIRKAKESVIRELQTISWFVDCGDDDVLFDVDIEFYRTMRNAKIPCQLRIKDGSHDWEYWHMALYTALPFFSRNFGI